MPRDVLNERKHVAAAVEAVEKESSSCVARFLCLLPLEKPFAKSKSSRILSRDEYFSFLNFGLPFQLRRNTNTKYENRKRRKKKKKNLGKINGGKGRKEEG